MSCGLKTFHRVAYQRVLKPILFCFDPEMVHDVFTFIGRKLGATKFGRAATAWMYRYQHSMLEQTILGIRFANPIGLGAGFDKNALLTDIMPSVGFGFEEAGSITGEPCEGNPKPRLWRLPKSRGLVVYYGLKNDGCEAIARRLRGKRFDFPLGVSVAKTNDQSTVEVEKGIDDYEKAFRALHEFADYVTVNISCPNAFGGEPFTTPERLDCLLDRLDKITTSKPIFLKLPVDISNDELDALVTVMLKHRVRGVVVSNLTKKRDRKEINQDEIRNISKGGISGKPTFEASNDLIKHLYKTTGHRFVIIGIGGVFCAQDAYEKIRCGASLVQLITGMIFEGPQLIGDINRGLVELLKRDGFKNISEAVGVDA
jgi:dihydroorotate dehydrogenase subfamily 2